MKFNRIRFEQYNIRNQQDIFAFLKGELQFSSYNVLGNYMHIPMHRLKLTMTTKGTFSGNGEKYA